MNGEREQETISILFFQLNHLFTLDGFWFSFSLFPNPIHFHPFRSVNHSFPISFLSIPKFRFVTFHPQVFGIKMTFSQVMEREGDKNCHKKVDREIWTLSISSKKYSQRLRREREEERLEEKMGTEFLKPWKFTCRKREKSDWEVNLTKY